MSFTLQQQTLIDTFCKKNTLQLHGIDIHLFTNDTAANNLLKPLNHILDFLQLANYLYRSGHPIIDDQHYDVLHAHLSATHTNHPFMSKVEPDFLETADHKTLLLPQKMLSTDKAYSIDEIARWVNRIEKCAKNLNIKASTIRYKITPKLDGFAAFDDGEKLYTRGDGTRGTDISHVFPRGLTPITGAKRGLGPGEIVISRPYFNKYLSHSFENTRNIQSAILAEKAIEPSIQKALNDNAAVFYPFSSLPSWIVTAQQLQDFLTARLDEVKTSTDFDTDGLVIEIIDENIKREMGATQHHHRWQIAFKENSEFAIVEVTCVEANTSRTGRITPVAHLVPTHLSGATLSKATAHNYGLVKKLGIAEGAKVKLVRSGLVIPKIIEVISPSNPKFPTKCPSCDFPVEWEGDNIYCTNKLHCPAQAENSIIHFFKTLGTVDGFGPSTITTLYNNNCRSIYDIYQLSKTDFEAIGFGPKISENLEKNLLLSRQRSIEDWKFLAAFGFRHLGKGKSERLLQHYNLEDICDLQPSDIIIIDGFGPASAEVIVILLQASKNVFFDILNLGFNIEQTPKSDGIKQITLNPVNGKLLVFTGTMTTGPRAQLEKEAKMLGAKTGKSITHKTDYLIAGDKSGNSKLSMAKDYGITVLSEDEYLNLVSKVLTN